MPVPSSQDSFDSAHKQITLPTSADDAQKRAAYEDVAAVVMAKLNPAWEETQQRQATGKRANYLSMEYLLGTFLQPMLRGSNLTEETKKTLEEKGLSLNDIIIYEPDPGLGNGGLGRLAACFVDSAANLGLPFESYGLFFHDGFFKQKLDANGRQIELPDQWLEKPFPWQKTGRLAKADGSPIIVSFGGRDIPRVDVPVTTHDLPIVSDDGLNINTLRLFEIDPQLEAMGPLGTILKRVNKQLYPDDRTVEGKDVRLAQEFLLSSAAVQDIVERHKKSGLPLSRLSETAAIQINDTHPALAIPELMRILVDENNVEWNDARQIVRSVCNYTNHTLAPEALERWHRDAIGYLLPRHGEIIEALQESHLQDVRNYYLAQVPETVWERVAPERNLFTSTTLLDIAFDYKESTGDQALPFTRSMVYETMGRSSLIDGDFYCMGQMAAFCSGNVNGVSAMHSELVNKCLFPDLQTIKQKPVINFTNGISPRRWLIEANPELCDLLEKTLRTDIWKKDLSFLNTHLRAHDRNPALIEGLKQVKKTKKAALSAYVLEKQGVQLPESYLLDSQVKRFHGYKRQLLNLLHVAYLYNDILENPDKPRPNVVKLFAGKAAAGYEEAKDCLALSNWLGKKINNDPRVGDKLKTVFLENYSVSLAKEIIPASDLSEQISVAGMEASGTSNMKFSLNGAMTIGTRDGANVEIGAIAGEENFFFFGLKEEEVTQINSSMSSDEYKNAYLWGEKNQRIMKTLEFLSRELHSDPEPAIQNLAGLVDRMLPSACGNFVHENDRWKICADFNAYCDKHAEAHGLYMNDPDEWYRRTVHNIAAGSCFSSDDTIKYGYAEKAWKINQKQPKPTQALEYTM